MAARSSFSLDTADREGPLQVPPELEKHSGSGSQEGITLSPAVPGPTVQSALGKGPALYVLLAWLLCPEFKVSGVWVFRFGDGGVGQVYQLKFWVEGPLWQKQGFVWYSLLEASPPGSQMEYKQAESLSTVSSVAPHDSASRSGSGLPLDNQLALLLTSSPSVQDMFSRMIASQLHICLSNMNLLPACSLPQGESLIKDRPSLPKTVAPSRVQQALPAKGSWEVSLEMEPTSVRPASASQSATPSNTPSSRFEVKGSLLSDSSDLSSSRWCGSKWGGQPASPSTTHRWRSDRLWFTNRMRCISYHSVKGRRGTEKLIPMPLSFVHQAHEGRASDTRPALCIVPPPPRQFSRREGEVSSPVGERKAESGFSLHLSLDTAAQCANTRKREARVSSSFLAYVTWVEDSFSCHLPSCFVTQGWFSASFIVPTPSSFSRASSLYVPWAMSSREGERGRIGFVGGRCLFSRLFP